MDQRTDQQLPSAFEPLAIIFKKLTSAKLVGILKELSIRSDKDYQPNIGDFTRLLDYLEENRYKFDIKHVVDAFISGYKTIEPIIWCRAILGLERTGAEDTFFSLIELINLGMLEVLDKANLLDELYADLESRDWHENTELILARIEGHYGCKKVRDEIGPAGRTPSGVWSAQTNVVDTGAIGSGFEGINAPKAGLVALPTPMRDR